MLRKLTRWAIALILVFGFSFSQLLSVASADEGSDGDSNSTILDNSTISMTDNNGAPINTVKPGDEVTVKLVPPASANLTSGGIELRLDNQNWEQSKVTSSRNDNANDSVYLSYNSSDGDFEGTYDIPKKAINGTWLVSDAYYYSNDENNQDDQSFNSSFSYQVDSSYNDMTAPTVNSISIDKSSVNAGDQVTVTVDAADDSNGVGIDEDNSYIEFGKETTNDDGNADPDGVWTVNLNHVSGTTYTGTFTVPKSSSDQSFDGKYFISNYAIYDKDGNARYPDYDKYIHQDNYSFTVNNGVIDTTSPVVTSVITDKDGQNVEAGHEIHVSVAASDDKSGISNKKSRFTALFESTTDRDDYDTIELTYNPSTQRYEGTFTVPLDATLGAWRLDDVNLVDNAGNSADYDYYYSDDSNDGTNGAALLANNKFTVVKDLTAPDAPKLNAVNDSALAVSGSAEAGSTVTISNDKTSWNATAAADGSFSISLPAQNQGTVLTATAKDASGNVSSSSSVTVTKTPIPVLFTAYLTKGHAVRTAPSATAQKLGSLPKGAAVQVIEAGTWDKILYNGQTAYVYGETSQTQPVLYTAYLTKGHAVRTAASINSKKIKTLKAGSSVSVLAAGKWTKIRYNGAIYYVWGKDLDKTYSTGKLVKKTALHKKASAKSHVLKTLKKKSKLKVLTKGKKWDKVVYSGKIGYILKKAVK